MKYKLQSFFRSFAAIAICSFSSQQLFAASTSAPGPIINIFDDLTTLSPAFGVNVFDVDTTLSADEVYLLEGTVFVPNGVTLTIEAGTTIYATDSSAGVGALVVARGGQINAAGTATAPIIFTAVEELEVERGEDLNGNSQIGPLPTVQDAGLWGGVILLGNAPISAFSGNTNVGQDQIEGFAPNGVDNDADGLVDILEYGTDGAGGAFPVADPADNSGVLQFVSIRHGGFIFGQANEINGLTLGGVGNGTTIDHVEVVANSDDGIEFFGGTVNTSHLAVAFCQDDSFDLDSGFGGEHQFWFAVQNPNSNRLGEWDGIDGFSDGVTPISAATDAQIYNVTFVGPGSGNTVSDELEALLIDDGFSGALFNSILTGKAENLATFTSDGTGGLFSPFANNTIGDFGSFDGDAGSVLSDNAPTDFYVTVGGLPPVAAPNSGNTAPGVGAGFALEQRTSDGFLIAIDPRPVAGSSALVDPTSVEPGSLEDVDYRGAFAPTGPTWLDGWSFLSTNGFLDAPVVAGEIAILDCGFDENGDFFIELDTDASGCGVFASQDLTFGSFLTLSAAEFSTSGNIITIDPAFVDFNNDGAVFFRVSL